MWAGKPVNYATKCAQAADRHELVITDRFYDLIKDNDYAAHSCGCQYALDANNEIVRTDDAIPGPLWGSKEVETLGEHSSCKTFPGASSWCEVHGNQFCSAIEMGLTDRPEVEATNPAALRDDEPESLAA